MSKNIIIFFCCLYLILFNPLRANAQFEALDRQSYLEKIHWVDSFYFALVTTDDSAKIFTGSKALKQYAISIHDEELELEAELFEAYYYRKQILGQDDLILKRLQAIAEKGRREKRIYITARAVNVIAMTYWFRYQNYELGFEYFQELEKLLTSVTPQQFPFMANCYYDIGRAFYIFKDYDKALYYLKKSSAVPETSFNSRIHCAADNMLGLSYQQLNKLDSSDLYFKKALSSRYITKENIQYTLILGNIGHNFYLKKDYARAIPLLQQDMNRALKNGRKGLAVGSATTLANIYLEQRRLKKVKLLTDSIFVLIRASKQWERLKLLYPVVSRYYAAIGDLQRSNQYLDSALNYNDSMARKFSSLQLKRANQKTDRAKEQAFQSASKQSRNLQLIFLLSTALIIITGIYIYSRQNKKNRYKEELKEKVLRTFKLELDKAGEQLLDFSSRLTEQSQQIEQFETQYADNPADHILYELRQRAILTEKDWVEFRQSFDKIHAGFIDRLQQKYPRISPAEIRILVLARLHFTTKEMATALGISPGSVRVTWHRLRKKLNISEDISIEELADLI